MRTQNTQILGLSIVFATILALSSFAFSSENFEMEVRHAQKVCTNLRCENSPLKLVTVNMNNSQELPRALLLKLQSLSAEIANNIWPDTIFEGGVVSAEDQICLEQVSLVFNDKGLIGYRISYSAIAYNMDVCSDYHNVRTCQKGRILESAFVSTDFSVTFTDYADLAHFIEDSSR